MSSTLEAPALITEKQRCYQQNIPFLGIIGDANHTWGYHVPAWRCTASDPSRQGHNNPPQNWDWCCAIDIGMGWEASRTWMRWLIGKIRADRIRGVAEVIGSLDGRTARYWSDESGWSDAGVAYTGSGHVAHTHISIYRSDGVSDRGFLRGWSRTGFSGTIHEEDEDMPVLRGSQIPFGFAMDADENITDRTRVVEETMPPLAGGGLKWGDGWLSLSCDFGSVRLRVAVHNGKGWEVRRFNVSSGDAREKHSWHLPKGTGKISIARVDVGDVSVSGAETPASWLVEIGTR